MGNISNGRTGICSRLQTHHGQERFHLGVTEVDRRENIIDLTDDSSIAPVASPSSLLAKDHPLQISSATASVHQTRPTPTGTRRESPPGSEVTRLPSATKEPSPPTRPMQHLGLVACEPSPTAKSSERSTEHETNEFQPSPSLPATASSVLDSDARPTTQSKDGKSASELISDALVMRSKDPLSSLLMEKNDSKLLVQMARAPSKETTLSGEDRSSQDSLEGAEGSYQCSVCFKVFDTLFDLTLHQMWPTENKTFSCKICGRAFHSCWNFVSHQLEHLSGALYRRDKGSVKHRGNKKDNSSTACNRMSIEKALSNNAENASSKTRYPCGTCGKPFPGRTKLLRHLLTHTDRKAQTGSVFAKSVVNERHLSQHKLTHAGQTLYPCSMCSRVFTRKSSLTRHAQVHSEYRPYVCSVCGESFPDIRYLQTHMRRHATVRPHCCSVCAKSFIEKSHLDAHMKTHSKPSFYPYGACNKSLAFNYPLLTPLLTQSLIRTEQRSYSCDVLDVKPI